jgi:hypothetical protein
VSRCVRINDMASIHMDHFPSLINIEIAEIAYAESVALLIVGLS